MDTQTKQRTPRQAKMPAPTPAPEPIEESKRERFLRIGTARMNRVLDHLRLLGNLSNSNYAWTDDDLRIMGNSIMDEWSKTITRFTKQASKAKAEFSFENFQE